MADVCNRCACEIFVKSGLQHESLEGVFQSGSSAGDEFEPAATDRNRGVPPDSVVSHSPSCGLRRAPAGCRLSVGRDADRPGDARHNGGDPPRRRVRCNRTHKGTEGRSRRRV